MKELTKFIEITMIVLLIYVNVVIAILINYVIDNLTIISLIILTIIYGMYLGIFLKEKIYKFN